MEKGIKSERLVNSSDSGSSSVDGRESESPVLLDWQEVEVEELAQSEEGGASEGSSDLSIGAAAEEKEVEKDEVKVLLLTPTLAQQLEQVLENQLAIKLTIDRLEKEKGHAEAKLVEKLYEFKQEMTDQLLNQQEVAAQIEHAKLKDPQKKPVEGRLMLAIIQFSTEFAKGEGWKDARFSAPAVQIGGFPWRIWAFPHKSAASSDGSSGSGEKTLAFFLQCDGNSNNEVPNWSCLAGATFRLKAQKEGQADKVIRSIPKTFTAKGNIWGFHNFVPLEDLLDPSKGWIDDADTVTLVADVVVEASCGGGVEGGVGGVMKNRVRNNWKSKIINQISKILNT